MRYRWDKKYLYWGVTAVAVIIAGLLLFAAIFRFDMIWGFFGTIFSILTPVLYGFAFAFILNPVVKRLHKLFMKTAFKKAKKIQRAEKISRAISIVAVYSNYRILINAVPSACDQYYGLLQ